MRERWRKIPGWPHQVSDRGRVRSLPRTLASGQVLGGEVLAQTRDKDGYLTVHLRGRGREARVPVHVLVATYFPCFEGLEVRHLNGQDDNRWTSLRWGTRRENEQDKKQGKTGIGRVEIGNSSRPFPPVSPVAGGLR